MKWVGVNLSGAEFGSAEHNQINTDYVMPSQNDLDYFAQKSMNIIRLPILWERAQSQPFANLNQTYLEQINRVIVGAAKLGMQVIIDLHNYGAGFGNLVGSKELPVSALADFWSKIASYWAGNPNVIFGIMNEPNQQTATDWAKADQAAITAIRLVGAGQEILASGTAWSGAASWDVSGNKTALLQLTDPLKNLAIDVHTYLDQDSSGTHYTPVTDPQIGADRLASVTGWAEQQGIKLFLGEIGAASDQQSLKALQNTFDYMQIHPVWQGITYWAAGDWWGDYPFSVEPTGSPGNYLDKPQMSVLQPFAQKSVGSDINSGSIRLTDRLGEHFTLGKITAGKTDMNTGQTDLTNRVSESVGSNGVITVATPVWNDIRIVNIYDGLGSSWATNAFMEVDATLSGAKNASLLLTNAKRGVLNLNGNYTVTINAYSNAADPVINGKTQSLNDFNIKTGEGKHTITLNGYKDFSNLTFTGGSGWDDVYAGAGKNQFILGSGQAHIWAGAGTNDFLYQANSGKARIENFSAKDSLTISSALKPLLTINSQNNSSVLDMGANHQIAIDTLITRDSIHWV